MDISRHNADSCHCTDISEDRLDNIRRVHEQVTIHEPAIRYTLMIGNSHAMTSHDVTASRMQKRWYVMLNHKEALASFWLLHLVRRNLLANWTVRANQSDLLNIGLKYKTKTWKRRDYKRRLVWWYIIQIAGILRKMKVICVYAWGLAIRFHVWKGN